MVCLMLLAIEGTAAEMRTWTDSTGQHQTEAEFVECRDGQVQLRKADGQIVILSLDKLSAADRSFVQGRHNSHGESVGGSGPARTSEATVVIEFGSGAKMTGRITARDDEYVTMEAEVNGRNFSRRYPVRSIQAVTLEGRRIVLGVPETPATKQSSGPAAEGCHPHPRGNRAAD